ncbi:sugar ABC transporter substrate-binding protein [Streptomyces oceani]|uniref:ABC transporter substrate-binding protein n=1 Tax=Streptomyces oceani TaxID=1075402 RepID=A0A1E7KKZ8_9ACTN|nr:substrate-binding domain-containing protein [Streptomyces oceani]OEV04501.1 ABC transporter substrate-binding protein [Streptomyces oceani]
MKTLTRRMVIGTAAISMSLALAACGEAGGGSEDEGGGDNKTIGLLLPENKTTRYETFDEPLMRKKINELCDECEVKYSNASQDTQKQKKQFDALITQGVEVIILDAVDATATRSWVDRAAERGVKVVAYDRLAEGDVSAYVSYDNEKIGELQGKAMVEALGEEAGDSRVVMINGSPTDPNAALYKKGAHSVLDEKVKKIVYEQDIPDWSPDQANKKMSAAITSLGKDGFDGVYAANDGMAGGVATALKGAGIKDLPLGGQDAELAGLQRIVSGTQSYTIYKAIKPEAYTTAEIAVALLNGKDIDEFTPGSIDSESKKDIPAKLFEAKVVTKNNIKETVIKDKVYKTSEICTKAYAKACAEAGLK